MTEEEETQRHTGRRWPCDNKGKDWSNVSTSEDSPRIDSKHQKLIVTRKDLPL